MVFGILAGAIVLFAWGRPRADIVAILVVLALMLSRVLTPREALAGFGDPAVILIAAIFVVGEALVNTGIAHRHAGVGQIGAGITRAPLECFTKAVTALGSTVPDETP